MAGKVEYVVVDGCIQDGKQIVKKGEVYSSSSKELTEQLIKEGKIGRRGQLPAAGTDDDDGA
ncbi:hypothetical protein [Pseudomonas cremoricolorata]|uniref:hypothetical protein n=1 Tax=Pseudomonas cremoricolorata TaxID=157783 RepID=UPI0004035CBF|nr:hypothetical protein [Pseudomonas cremoricolorata]